MKAFISILCVLFGIAIFAGCLYLGIWTMFIGGIIGIIEAAKMDPINSLMIATGIAKVIFFELPCVIGLILMIACFKAAGDA